MRKSGGLGKKVELLRNDEAVQRVFYLATPPSLFAGICHNLASRGLATPASRVDPVADPPPAVDHGVLAGVCGVFPRVACNNPMIIEHPVGRASRGHRPGFEPGGLTPAQRDSVGYGISCVNTWVSEDGRDC